MFCFMLFLRRSRAASKVPFLMSWFSDIKLKRFAGLPPADLQLDRERLARLESDRTEDRSSMQSQESRITQLEQSLIYQNVELQTHNSRIAVLKSNKSSDQGVLNHTARLLQLEANMDELNSTLTRFKGICSAKKKHRFGNFFHFNVVFVQKFGNLKQN